MKWVKQLFCFHFWQEAILPRSHKKFFNNMHFYGVGILKVYECPKCGKEVLKSEDPINFYKEIKK